MPPQSSRPAAAAERIVIVHRPGPMWPDPKHEFLDQEGLRAHIDHYRILDDRGLLLLGGPFLNDGGGMMIVAGEAGLERMRRFAGADPAVKSGLLLAEVYSWFAFLGTQGSGER